MNSDTELTMSLKQAARAMGADLVGVGPIERWEKCPVKMSPKGLLPDGVSVLVCGVHHIDGMVEVGGETSPHDLGPYAYQYYMNSLLDHLSYGLAMRLEEEGFEAVPITASNIWRYRPYKELASIFSPDMSNIYASVAAGLTEMGMNGLALSPEYGARNRFVSIVTTAPLAPDPLLPGGTICDRCGLCRKMCPMEAFTKEVEGETFLEIEDRRYGFLKKNLWRCAWAEHFGLSVDLPAPETVDEAAILRAVEAHGVRGGTIGYCLKFCLPADRRVWDRGYSRAPRRRQPFRPAETAPPAAVQKALLEQAVAGGVLLAQVVSRENAEKIGIDAGALLPDVRSFVLLARPHEKESLPEIESGRAALAGEAAYLVQDGVFRLGRRLEDMGYSCAPYGIEADPENGFRKRVAEALGGADFAGGFLATSAELAERSLSVMTPRTAPSCKLSGPLKRLARETGAQQVGISSVERIEALLPGLKNAFEGERLYDARDRTPRWLPSVGGEVRPRRRTVRGPRDFLPTARSVLVLAARLPRASVRECMRAPGEAIGPVAFAEAQVQRELRRAALRVIQRLEAWNYAGVAVSDLAGAGSELANPRGPQPNAFCNRFAALCAGLGAIGTGGFLISPRFGANLRMLAIVTDAPLDADPLPDFAPLLRECARGCRRCLDACELRAHGSVVSLAIEGRSVTFRKLDTPRCDWALRFGLTPDEGTRYTGSKSHAEAPANITPEALSEGFRGLDPILKARPCVAERCLLACPHSRPAEAR